ncbi:TniB family NTP-binding protein [Paenibacillus oenotherae]|uniref:TniB family NTP-binding protein n=1 Tax=Paenibacillus oenotherae TaxID=1435645 RepID=A0ABS7D314_9BACL|nr:TniB family NTP-binding protein [Paenibacillus oenotherae]
MSIKKLMFQTLSGKPLSFRDPEYKLRLEYMKKMIVKHPQYQEVSDELEELHITSKDSVQASHLNLCGQTGVGKTTVVKEYAKKFPKKHVGSETIIPVLYLKVPPRLRTPKALASKILAEMGDLFANSGTDEELGRRIVDFAKDSKMEMLILDEFQHLIDRDTQNVLATASDWLKLLTEELNIPVVLCGLPESNDIFEYNEQIDGRYPRRILLEPFGFEDQEQQRSFRMFLKYIDEELPFPEHSNLSDPLLASKIHYVTEGVPRYVKDLMIEAAKLSLKRGFDRINEESLHDAFNRITRSNQRYAINPFLDSKFEYFAELKKQQAKIKAFIDERQSNSKRKRKKTS